MRGELIFNAVLFGLAMFLYYVAGTFRAFAPYAKSGPEFWPRGILLGMILLSGILLIKNITSLLRSGKATATGESSVKQEGGRVTLCLVVVVSFAFAFGMGLPSRSRTLTE